MKNPRLLESVSNVPYALLAPVFRQINITFEQLIKLEDTNIIMIFDDDELWLSHLKQEYPAHVHESFLSNAAPIIRYYKDNMERARSTMDDREVDMFQRCLKQRMKKDPHHHKYMIPYRMLFQQYHKDTEHKKQQSEERLRQSIHKLDEERRQKQTVTVDYSAIIQERRLTGKGKKRQYWDDRTPIKSIDKFNNGAYRNKVVRPPPSRVAFGGAVGRQTTRAAPKVVSSPMTELRRSTKPNQNGNHHHSQSSPDASDAEDTAPKPRAVIPTPSRRRDSSKMNIFLNKKSIPPLRRTKSNEMGGAVRTNDRPSPRNAVSSPESSPKKNRVSLSDYKSQVKRPLDGGNSSTQHQPPKKQHIGRVPAQSHIEERPGKSHIEGRPDTQQTNPGRDKMRSCSPNKPPKPGQGTRKQSKFFHNDDTNTKAPRIPSIANPRIHVESTITHKTANAPPPAPKRTQSLKSYLSKK